MTCSTLAEAKHIPSHHEDKIADVYAMLALVESRLDGVRLAIRTRFDRIESRLSTGLAESAGSPADPGGDVDDRTLVESHLVGIDRHLAGLAAEFDGMEGHLAGIDDLLSDDERGPRSPASSSSTGCACPATPCCRRSPA